MHLLYLVTGILILVVDLLLFSFCLGILASVYHFNSNANVEVRAITSCSLEVFSKEQITQIYNSTFKSIKIINNTNYTYIH